MTPREITHEAFIQATGFIPHAVNAEASAWSVLWRTASPKAIIITVELTGVGGAVIVDPQVDRARVRPTVLRLKPSDATVEKIASAIRSMLSSVTLYVGPRGSA